MPPATDDVIAALDALRTEVEACTRCPLHETRTRAVFGEGDAASDLMFVGEAPGYHEDQQGRPFVGQAGKLLEQLLASIGLTREQVFIANVLKSRPPNNRDPRPDEIAACQPYLRRQIELIRPRIICTLGNHATKLLTGNPAGITRVHGQPQAHTINDVDLYLFPIFHPAAALYTPAMLDTLKQDFLRLPELLAHAAPQGGQAAGAPGAERPAWRPPQRQASPSGDGRQSAGDQPDLLSVPPQAAETAAAEQPASPPGEPASSPAPGPPDEPAPSLESGPPRDEPALPSGAPAPGPPDGPPPSPSSGPPPDEQPAQPAAPGRSAAVPGPPDARPLAESGPPEQLGLF